MSVLCSTAPPADLHEGINSIRVIVTDFCDLSKRFPSYPMYLLPEKLFRVITRKKMVGIA